LLTDYGALKYYI